ncbi:hypothetical protein AVEN_129120-1 [Araneus ventricosus]|uniref:Reverse transcriptase domain-containing protein n=1 Tax=Araneus ventricosus TaxID=182803 RepID=A0A4Y2B393_ARAVE|nr:hypothetical protein AVEN_129120-1 [Araneus ventricosus]
MPETQLALFADDTAIMCTGPNGALNVANLNRHLAELEKWLIRWFGLATPHQSGAAANMHFLGLERLQNMTVRQIARQPWYIRNRTIRKDLRLPTIQEYFKSIAERLFKKIDSSSNTALHNIPAYDPRGNRNRRRPRAALHR